MRSGKPQLVHQQVREDYPLCGALVALDIKPEEDDVAVLHDVFFAF